MIDNEYVCGYKHCLHRGQMVKESESVVEGNRHYHMDCAITKNGIAYIRNIYADWFDPNVNYAVLMKVINDLVFKYGLDVDYIRYSLEYYHRTRTKIKSPFVLLYLRNNRFMKEKWERFGQDDSRKRLNNESQGKARPR